MYIRGIAGTGEREAWLVEVRPGDDNRVVKLRETSR